MAGWSARVLRQEFWGTKRMEARVQVRASTGGQEIKGRILSPGRKDGQHAGRPVGAWGQVRVSTGTGRQCLMRPRAQGPGLGHRESLGQCKRADTQHPDFVVLGQSGSRASVSGSRAAPTQRGGLRARTSGESVPSR